jgi:1,4-dihydroxy-2-naphthoate polyprenyltransferase
MMLNGTLKNWFMAIRPKTLPAAVAPVMIGAAMAFGDGVHHGATALICLIAALAIQIGTNLANDYYDFKHGADTTARIGPTRVTQAGLIRPKAVRLGFVLAFGFAAICSLWLIRRGGWPIAVIGVTAMLSGIFYTAGPRPLGYIGLGDLFVLIFFGPVAVGGTYYVQSYEMNAAVLLAGFAPGLISVAILTVNNLRDIDSDRQSGKRTLAVRFGRSFAVTEYLFCLMTAAGLAVVIYMLIRDHVAILACVGFLLLAIPSIKTVLTSSDGPALNRALGTTGKLLMIYSILFSVGWIV